MALSLAAKGAGLTSPNPMVGAVLVKNCKVLAKGYHKKAGLAHAEVDALKKAGKAAKGATLYVNLEPCSHFGRTPPCVDRIIDEGIRRVVIGMRDPNPVNNGRGVRRLMDNGVKVTCGILEAESEKLNRAFRSHITLKRPYVTIKVAQSIDGKIATYAGHSKWITNESSRKFVHKIRERSDAILVGVNTVIKDNPMLNARTAGAKKQPIKVVLDSGLRIPLSSNVIKSSPGELLIATTRNAPKKKIRELQKIGVNVVTFGKKNGMVDIRSLLKYLSKNDITRLLVEGGGTVISGFLNSGLTDEMLVFISPKVIGGRDALTAVEGQGVRSVNNAVKLKDVTVRRFKEDILVTGYVYGNN